METKPEHEIFGEDVDFEHIRDIKRVFQPGMLSSQYFFNPVSLRNSVSELCGPGSEDILVYFKVIGGINITSNDKDEKRKWWGAFQDFIPLVERIPAGCEVGYWYGSDGKEYLSPEFKESTPPYQAFAHLFGKGIDGFSSFVNQNPNKIDFSSWTYSKPDGSLAGGKTSVWIGKSDVLLESAWVLNNAFHEMEREGYKVGSEEMVGDRRKEIRIIHPERGALVGSLYGKDSITLFLEKSSLVKLVEQSYRRLMKQRMATVRGRSSAKQRFAYNI
ncbi:MAG: hypothetical protein WC494_02665 [Candidatus Pacearchaeota archaeon]